MIDTKNTNLTTTLVAMQNNNEITFFAKTNFRNQERVFGIKTDDRRRHMYIIGKTGMGKTNLLENMAVQDIRNGHGVCYIDPHGDTAEKLLKAIPSERINDVIYFNPADQAFPIAFNAMESIDPEYRHLVASGLVGVFKKIWADSWGPRLEYILRNAIMGLLEYPGSTLLGVTRILVDKKYRDKVVERITDPVIRQFWVDEFPKWSDKVLQEVVSPIQNKVGQFLSNSLIRNIVGQPKSSFDVRTIMDERKILIMNLSKGRIGEDASALLGAMMITKIQLAAMGRVDIPEETRKDFYLYVDEFQNFSTESFANILSEARKYRLNLILANQYVEQIAETVRNAIFGNVGSIISFRVGAMDAEFLEKEFSPVFLQNDIVNLPKYNIYLKLMIDGIAGDAFSATTLPPIYIDDTKENEGKVIAVSRERYGSPRVEVEEKIARWAGMVPVSPAPMQGAANQVSHEGQKNQASAAEDLFANPAPADLPREEKELFDALCETCGDQIKVPFKPDGKRPTFCKDCLKDFQRMQAKAKLKQERFAAMGKPLAQEKTVPVQAAPAPASQKTPSAGKDFRREAASGPRSFEKKPFTPKGSEMRQRPLRPAPAKPSRQIERKVIAPEEKPMSLSSLSGLGPKKFEPTRKKVENNLDDIRSMIGSMRKD